MALIHLITSKAQCRSIRCRVPRIVKISPIWQDDTWEFCFSTKVALQDQVGRRGTLLFWSRITPIKKKKFVNFKTIQEEVSAKQRYSTSSLNVNRGHTW